MGFGDWRLRLGGRKTPLTMEGQGHGGAYCIYIPAEVQVEISIKELGL